MQKLKIALSVVKEIAEQVRLNTSKFKETKYFKNK